MSYPIDELYAWIIDDPSGTHGIVAFHIGPNIALACTSEPRLARKMEGGARRAASMSGLPVKLQRFILVETV